MGKRRILISSARIVKFFFSAQLVKMIAGIVGLFILAAAAQPPSRQRQTASFALLAGSQNLSSRAQELCLIFQLLDFFFVFFSVSSIFFCIFFCEHSSSKQNDRRHRRSFFFRLCSRRPAAVHQRHLRDLPRTRLLRRGPRGHARRAPDELCVLLNVPCHIGVPRFHVGAFSGFPHRYLLRIFVRI
jgi:hypothetical protein